MGRTSGFPLLALLMCNNSQISYYYDKLMSTKFAPSMNLEKDPPLQFILMAIECTIPDIIW